MLAFQEPWRLLPQRWNSRMTAVHGLLQGYGRPFLLAIRLFDRMFKKLFIFVTVRSKKP